MLRIHSGFYSPEALSSLCSLILLGSKSEQGEVVFVFVSVR